MQIDPIKRTLKPPGATSHLLTLKCDEALSTFAFKFNLRRYTVGQLEETLSTLKFAQRAKLVKVTATANEEAIGSAVELAAEVVRLRAVIAEGAGEGVREARARASELEAHVTRANRAAAAHAKHSAGAYTRPLFSST